MVNRFSHNATRTPNMVRHISSIRLKRDSMITYDRGGVTPITEEYYTQVVMCTKCHKEESFKDLNCLDRIVHACNWYTIDGGTMCWRCYECINQGV